MAHPKISRELMQEAVDAVAKHGGITQAARALKLPTSTLKSRGDEARKAGLKPSRDIPQDAAQRLTRDLVGAQDRIRQLEADIKQMHRSELTAENVREQLFGLAAASPKPPSWVIEAPKKSKTGSGVPSALWSDWHFSEVVDPAQVNGVNEFTIDIARTRIRRLTERTIDLCFNHMTNPNYPGLVLNLGGDMLSGDIHEELTETNELPTMPAMLELFELLVWSITQLHDRFGPIFIPCEFGNHGRNTHRPRAKHAAYTNFDWLLYNMLERHFRAAGAKDVQFLIPTSTDAYYRVHNHRYLLTHGNAIGVKGGDGIIGALGPILRGDTKIRSASAQMGMPYDTLLMGHWHQFLPVGSRVIVNGTLKGFDEFAKDFLRASPEVPQQALWFTHERHGITCHWPVKLGEKYGALPAGDWTSWRSAA